MSGSNLAVKVSADVIDLTSKFAIAKASVSALNSELNGLAKQSISGIVGPSDLGRMQQLAGDLTVAKSAVSNYAQELRGASAPARDFGNSIGEMRSAISGAFELTGIGFAIEGIRRLAGAVDEFGQRAAQMQSYSEVLGVTVEQYQTLQLAAEDAGVSSDVLTRATENLAKMLSEARDGSGAAVEKLRDLGVTTSQINDATYGTAAILQTLHDRLLNSATATQTMSALTRDLGARAVLAAAALKGLELSDRGVANTMSEVNGLSMEQTKQLSELYATLGKLKTGFENTASKALLLGERMLQIGPRTAVVEAVFKAAADHERSAQAVADAARTGSIQRQVTQAQAAAAAKKAAIDALTIQDLNSIKERIAGEAQGTAARLALVKQFYQDSLKYYGSGNVDKVQEAHSQLLAETREYNARQEQLSNDLMRRLESDLNHQVQSEQRTQEAFKRAAQESARTASAELEARRESVLGQIALQKQLAASAQGGAARGGAQSAGEEIALTSQELEAWEQFYQAKMALASGDQAAMATLQAQRLAKEQQIDGQILRIQSQGAHATQEQWLASIRPIGEAFDSTIFGMIRGTQTMRQSMQRLAGSLVEDMVRSTTIIVEKWLVGEITKTSATVTGNTLRTASTVAAAASSKVASASAGSSTVMADAAKAFSGTYASVAQIPYVGWILAPAAATAAYAAVAAYEGLASLDVGTAYVPRDMPAMLHQGEAVMPKPWAESMRRGELGGLGGSGAETHHHTHHHWNVSAIDGPSVKRLLSDPQFRRMFQSA
jgi:hypothetical protein